MTDNVIDLDLGLLFNHMIGRMDDFNGRGAALPTHVPRTNRSVAFMTLYAYIYHDTATFHSGIVKHPLHSGGRPLRFTTDTRESPIADMFADLNILYRRQGGVVGDSSK